MSPRPLALAFTVLIVMGLLCLGSQSGSTPAESHLLAFQNQEAQPDKKAADQKKEDEKKPAAEAEKKEAAEPAAGKPANAQAPAGAQRTAEFVGTLIRTARGGGAQVLSEGDSYDDFASLAQAADGTVYLAYAAYYDGHDQIRLHRRFPKGGWSTRTNVPLVRGAADIWMPQLAVDARDRLWVIWCEQTGQSAEKTGNWDLYARSLAGEEWGPIVRLTDDPKPDINPHVFTDAARNIHVVWQA
ncbi:MAG TPA: hypothetical protein VGH74_03860, partial [Planctomycetaceae bacterium]